jgi:GntR family transcriptional regulator
VPLERLTIHREVAAPQLGDAEGVAAASYVHVQSIFCRDGSPYSSASIHLASDIFELGRDRFHNMATVVAIDDMREVRVRTARQTLTVGCADPGLALALEVPVGSPTLVSRRVIVDERGVAISVGDITYRSDVIQLEIDLLIVHPNATWRSLQTD